TWTTVGSYTPKDSNTPFHLELCREVGGYPLNSCVKEEIRRKEVLTAEDFEYISDEATNHQLEYIST
ncbi:MAG: hypothetical protein M1335_03840, partial [Chloroflexi bacterium]|nr:hypothetical protein [Chloroflexota bacterium]